MCFTSTRTTLRRCSQRELRQQCTNGRVLGVQLTGSLRERSRGERQTAAIADQLRFARPTSRGSSTTERSQSLSLGSRSRASARPRRCSHDCDMPARLPAAGRARLPDTVRRVRGAVGCPVCNAIESQTFANPGWALTVTGACEERRFWPVPIRPPARRAVIVRGAGLPGKSSDWGELGRWDLVALAPAQPHLPQPGDTIWPRPAEQGLLISGRHR